MILQQQISKTKGNRAKESTQATEILRNLEYFDQKRGRFLLFIPIICKIKQ